MPVDNGRTPGTKVALKDPPRSHIYLRYIYLYSPTRMFQYRTYLKNLIVDVCLFGNVVGNVVKSLGRVMVAANFEVFQPDYLFIVLL